MAREYKTNEVKVDLASYRHYWRGVKKAGKTTLFYQLMMKLYGDPSYGLELSVGNERGYKALDGMVYDEAPDWGTLMEIVDCLREPWRADMDRKIHILKILDNEDNNEIKEDFYFQMFMCGHEFRSSVNTTIVKVRRKR